MTRIKRTGGRRAKGAERKVDETSRESFPASDPPAWASGREPAAPFTRSTPSYWAATAAAPRREPLDRDATAEVCVVGAGFAGLHAAYALAKLGRSVVVLDAAQPAGGQSALTTAHMDCVLDDGFHEMERVHGVEITRQAADSHRAAIDWMEKIVADEGIACEFERVDGYLFLDPGQPLRKLEREHEAALRAGVEVEWAERAPLDGYHTGPALRFPRQAQLHAVKYLNGLAAAVEKLGGRVYGGTRVGTVVDGEPCRVQAAGGLVTAKSVIVATNVPVNDRLTLQTRLYPYRTYVIAGRVPKGEAVKALYWDTAEPYHYARLAPGPEAAGDLLIIGGEDHKTGQADDAEARFARLEAWARTRFPKLRTIEYSWSGQVIEPQDGLAFIGRNPREKHVFVVTGDSGQGTTHGAMAGLVLSGQAGEWARIYRPSRPKRRGARHWLKENLNAGAQYADHLLPGDVSDENEIPSGAGAVLRRGLSKVAAYRDDDGTLREFSAVCPHLGGVLCWNHAEKSWDCPAHGSRFGVDGRVLNGPANIGLRPVLEEGPGATHVPAPPPPDARPGSPGLSP